MDSTRQLPTVLSFCSGYGGLERGLDLAGVEHRVIAYVEIEAFAIANLVNKMENGQLPPAPIWTNIKTFPSHLFRGAVDLITGGYPCQPFSAAGQRQGENDPRHLWPFISHHVGVINPSRVFFENVEGHVSLGLNTVLADLEDRGFDTTWGIFSAREVGAPHQRKRVFILGNTQHAGSFSSTLTGGDETSGHDNPRGQNQTVEPAGASEPSSCGDIPRELADTGGNGRQGQGEPIKPCGAVKDSSREADNAVHECVPQLWPTEPSVGRVVDGCTDRMDRIRLLGNGVVPQTAARAWTVLDKELTQ